jgi:hypothetical protein
VIYKEKIDRRGVRLDTSCQWGHKLRDDLESKSDLAEVGISRHDARDAAFLHGNEACQIGERNSWFISIPYTQLPRLIEAIWIDMLDH